MISDKNDREFISCTTELFLQSRQSLIVSWIPNIESFHFEGRDYGLQRWKITLKNDLTGLAIFSVEEIDLNGRRGLGLSENWKREKEGTEKDGHELFHHLPFNSLWLDFQALPYIEAGFVSITVLIRNQFLRAKP
jgi:hypothetical protein